MLNRLTDYHLPEPTTMAVPVSGRYLAHNRLNRVRRAFLGADLHLGAKALVTPTIVQSARLAGVNCTYVGWAIKRQAERAEIEAGFVPLVPARIDGKALIVPGIDDAELERIACVVGPDRMIAAAVVAEQAVRP